MRLKWIGRFDKWSPRAPRLFASRAIDHSPYIALRSSDRLTSFSIDPRARLLTTETQRVRTAESAPRRAYYRLGDGKEPRRQARGWPRERERTRGSEDRDERDTRDISKRPRNSRPRGSRVYTLFINTSVDTRPPRGSTARDNIFDVRDLFSHDKHIDCTHRPRLRLLIPYVSP